MSDNTVNRERRRALKVLVGSVGVGILGAIGFLHRQGPGLIQIYQESRSILGTLIQIRIHHPDARAAAQAASAAFAAINDVDRVMSIHRTDSDLSCVNRNAGADSVRVAPMLTDILQLAGRIHELSAGAYDVTCLPVMRLYGFYNSGARHFPSDREVLKILDAVGERYVAVDAVRNEVGFQRAGGGIDLGSIGKGFAVDRAADTLRAHGIRDALIDAGGNIVAMGSASDSEVGWSVAIRNPVTGGYFETLTLHDEGVATSGNYEQSIILDGRRVGHLFDLRNGHPSDGHLSTTVVAKSAALSDALSTTLFVLGSDAPDSLTRLARTVYHHTVAG